MTDQTLFPHYLRIPPELPESIRDRLRGETVCFDIPRSLKLLMRHPEKIKVSEWAEKYRVVTDGAHVGPWRTELAPHTRKIMDTFGLPYVRELWYCAVEQSGKTATMLNCIGWAIDCDPGGIFYLMPTEDTAAKITGGKLRPMLQLSPRLARYLSPRQDDATLSRINLAHGVTIHPAHANSPSSMATWSAKHCFGDEVDKYPAMAGKEADPITLIKKRNRTFRGRYKRFFASTPAGQFIYRGMQACHQVWEYRLKCPHCDDYIRLDVDCLIYNSSNIQDSIHPTPEVIEQAGATVACPACACQWDQHDREAAIRTGRWHAVKGSELTRPAKVGFHHRAWECLDISITEIAVAYLRDQQGGISEKIAWANGYEAIDYEPEAYTGVGLEHLATRAEEYGPHIPSDACLLTAGADIQQDRIEVEIVAWGPGSQSWGVMYTVLWGDTRLPEVWDQLDRHLLQTFTHAHGATLGISRAFIDAGYLPQQVYRFTGPRRARGLYAVEGSETVDAPEVSGPTNRHRAGMAIPVYRLGVNRIKSQLFGHLALETVGPGYCHLPTTYPENWYQMIQAEHAVPLDKRPDLVRWEKRKSGLRNEAIDCRVYAMAALLSMRVDLKGMLAELQTHTDPQPEEHRTRPTKQRRW